MMLERFRKLFTSAIGGSLNGSAGRIIGGGAGAGGIVVLSPSETASIGGATTGAAGKGADGSTTGVVTAKGTAGITAGAGTGIKGTAAGADTNGTAVGAGAAGSAVGKGAAGGVIQKDMVRSEAEDPERSSWDKGRSDGTAEASEDATDAVAGVDPP